MEKKICLLLLVPLLSVGVISCKAKREQAKDVDVVIISGQSNAVGCTKSDCISSSISMEKYEEYTLGYPEIQIAYDCWTKDFPATGITYYSQNKSRKDDFTKISLGQGNSLSTFGPEIGIAEATHEKHANKLFLVKFACGASNLKDDWLKKNSPMYPRLVSYVKLQMDHLKEKGYNPTIKAFCWMQGEGDSYPGYHNVYLDNLTEFVSNIRAEFKEFAGGNEELPFIDAAINPDRDVWQYGPEVNAAKQQFAALSENNIYIDTVAAGLHTDQEPFFSPDKCHYDSPSQVLLGNLFAQAFEPFLLK